MVTIPKTVKFWDIEFHKGPWIVNPLQSGMIKYTPTGNSLVFVRRQKGTLKTYTVKSKNAVYVFNDVAHIPSS